MTLLSLEGCTNPETTEPATDASQEKTPDRAVTDRNSRETKADSAPDKGADWRPPEICKTPKALGAGPYFKDITKQMKLGDGDGLIPAHGIRLSAADIDGDGYAVAADTGDASWSCEVPDGYAADTGDCDDDESTATARYAGVSMGVTVGRVCERVGARVLREAGVPETPR